MSDLSPLSGLANLQDVNCSSTQVSDLSPLSGFANLRRVDCSGTQVGDLSPLIASPRLANITANGCRLSDLPRALLFMQTLALLYLFGSAVPGVPAEILSEHHLDNCLNRLRSHVSDLEAGSEEVREFKLVVLGNGRLGKTQICRRLRGLPYDETISSTHGITVTAEPWVGAAASDTMNIWDFGGQDIYHGAHTLFMKTSAVFLIAWHPDFETSVEQSAEGMVFRNYPLSYWLEYVRNLGRADCPVVVTQTRCDRPEQEARKLPVDEEFLRFPSLKPCWYSAKTNRGRGALDDALRDAVVFLRERDGISTIGSGRMRVLVKLERWRNEDQARAPSQREHRTLSRQEFLTLCEESKGVTSPESLLEFLHNLGIVFYRHNLFHDRIILDQSWALEAIYAVFDRGKAYPLILNQGGKFTRSLLEMTVWRAYSPAEQELFLSLMESCGVAFVYRAKDARFELETEYLAPDLLPDRTAVSSQLSGRWDGTVESWRLEYEYPFLHPSLMRAIICAVGRRSHESGVYWKYGLWVYEQATGCRALIEQHMTDERRGRISLKLQGRRHSELGSWLRARIEEYNRMFGFPDLQPALDELASVSEDGKPGEGLRVVANPPAGASSRRGAITSDPASVPLAIEPKFEKLPAAAFPQRAPEIFVSYAWGDATIDGRKRGVIVDNLCDALKSAHIRIRRDQNDMKPGDLITEFMDRLADGDFIIALISDKYLRSEYCMYELFRIYRNCADKPERFLRHIVPLVLPDARLDSLTSRLARAQYWKTQADELKPLVQANVEVVGSQFYRKFKLIDEFARNTSDILEHLVDKLEPRDFDEMAKTGFQEVLEQVRPFLQTPAD